MNKGCFITFEGGEGSGKTTLLNQIAHHLRAQGYEVVQTREPGGTSLGETIRQWLLHHSSSCKIGYQAELLLFLAARAQHIEEVIRPALEAGKIVLCDRFNDSTLAYQGVARQLDSQEVQELCHFVCGDVDPQLTFFLDVDPELGLIRSRHTHKAEATKGSLDRIETEALAFHQQVRQAFQQLTVQYSQRIYRLDANQPQEKVFQAAIQKLENLLNNQ